MNNQEDLDFQVNKIIEAVCDLGCYKDYLFFLEKVKENPSIYNKIKQLKKLQFEFNNMKQNGQQPDFSYEIEMDKIYSDIMISPEGIEFLNSERAVMNEISDIFEKIIEGANIKFEF